MSYGAVPYSTSLDADQLCTNPGPSDASVNASVSPAIATTIAYSTDTAPRRQPRSDLESMADR
jgi:hypothetical protein